MLICVAFLGCERSDNEVGRYQMVVAHSDANGSSARYLIDTKCGHVWQKDNDLAAFDRASFVNERIVNTSPARVREIAGLPLCK